MECWLEESFLQLLRSPVWKYYVQTFIDENCLIFDNEEENRLPYTNIHRKYKAQIEGMLDEYMDDFGITMTQLMEACSTGLANKYKNHFKYLLAVGDFLLFKSIMVDRNIELCKEVESQVEKQLNPQPDTLRQSLPLDDVKSNMKMSKYEKDFQEAVERSILDHTMDDNKALTLAKKESLKTYEKEENLQKVKIKEMVEKQEKGEVKHTNTETDEPLSTNVTEEIQKNITKLPKLTSKHQSSTSSDDIISCDDAASQWVKSAMKESDQCYTPLSSTNTVPLKYCDNTTLRQRAIYLNKRRTMIQEMKQKQQEELDQYKLEKKKI